MIQQHRPLASDGQTALIVLARIRMYVRMYVWGEIVKRKEREISQMTEPVLSLYKIVHAYVRTYVYV